MFDKEKFGIIIKKINDSYPTQHDFADYSNVNRTYLSKYINMKLDTPPKPKILDKIANASRGITTYDELMQICGYIQKPNNSLSNTNDDFFTVPIFANKDGKLHRTNEDIVLPGNLDTSKQYLGYMITNNDMAPLLDIGDIAIIQKQENFESGQTCLFSIDNNKLLIRKIIDFDSYIELYTVISFANADMKLTKEEMKKRNFTILGRVIKSENNSAFK